MRRRLCLPSTSGSARRRARERRAAEATRAECERIARAKREQLLIEKMEQQRQAREELSSYEPWGKPGGGAPNPDHIRFRNMRLRNLYPEDELKGIANVNLTTWQWPGRRKKAPTRLVCHEDSQFRHQFAEDMRRAVDNDIRYRLPPDLQQHYRETLDNLVETRKNAIKDETRKDVEFEKKMGWTDDAAFNKLKTDHTRVKRSSLSLPPIRKTKSIQQEKHEEKSSNVEKLPDLNTKKPSEKERTKEMVPAQEHSKPIKNTDDNNQNEKKVEKGKVHKKSKKKNTVVKRLSNGEKVTRLVADDSNSSEDIVDKTTPESTILRMTGGIELVPLLARRRRVGARTLPSSDVTRPPDDHCQWRDVIHEEYLRELKNQMQVKFQQDEECRQNSAENCRRHHATWAALWGRPGHGAPQPGRHYRNNLTHLLFLAPLAPPPVQ